MTYEASSHGLPSLAMALGGEGGYYAFRKVMDYVDPGTIAKHGSIYLVEILDRGPLEWADWIMFRNKGIDLRKVERWMEMETGGVYFQPGAYVNRANRILTLDRNSPGECLRFVRTPPDGNYTGSGPRYAVRKALDIGYGSKMMLVALSGGGNDGCDALDEIGSRKAAMGQDGENIPRIVLQDYETVSDPVAMRRMHQRARELDVESRVLTPEWIGLEINSFLGSFPVATPEWTRRVADV